MRALRTEIPKGFLAVLSGAVAAALYTFPSLIPLDDVIEVTKAKSDETVKVLAVSDLTDFEPIRDAWSSRPPFSEKRRVVPVEIDLAEPAQYTIDQQDIETAPELAVRFVGFLSRDGNLRGLFLDETTGKEHWITVGSELAGWRLAEISHGIATFTQGESFHSVAQFP